MQLGVVDGPQALLAFLQKNQGWGGEKLFLGAIGQFALDALAGLLDFFFRRNEGVVDHLLDDTGELVDGCWELVEVQRDDFQPFGMDAGEVFEIGPNVQAEGKEALGDAQEIHPAGPVIKGFGNLSIHVVGQLAVLQTANEVLFSDLVYVIGNFVFWKVGIQSRDRSEILRL